MREAGKTYRADGMTETWFQALLPEATKKKKKLICSNYFHVTMIQEKGNKPGTL